MCASGNRALQTDSRTQWSSTEQRRTHSTASDPRPRLQVDGGIDCMTVVEAAAHGANVVVAGTAVFGAPDAGAAIQCLRQAVDAAATAAGKGGAGTTCDRT